MDPLVITAVGAFLFLWLGAVLFWCFVRWMVRRELRKAIGRLADLGWIKAKRDTRTGRYCK